MRRTALFLLLLAFLLPLAACQRAAEPSTGTLPTVTADAVSEQKPTPTPAPPVSTPEPTPTPAPAPEPTEKPFVFTRANFPRLNGSTSTVPLAEAVCSALLGESREDVGDLIHFSKTTRAYRELLGGYADLLIIGEANADILAEKEAKGFEWLKTPFATDAFVFVVNEANPVESITVAEARKIYTGEITNWAELGGRDEAIIPFQRNAEAGSQTLMEKHVMQGTPMMEAPADYVVASMGGLMEAVKSYDNSAGAIGYSVYYYAEEMKAAQGLKLLKLEGVEPCPETIRSEEYPIVNPKYVVISAEAATDSPTRRLYDWLLSEEGQILIASEGYVSVMEFETAPKAADVEPVGVFWEGEWRGLEPLTEPEWVTPYAGQRLFDRWPSRNGCLYGLMTAEGRAVTPPVYSSVSTLMWRSWFSAEFRALAPLVLRQGSGEQGEWGHLRSAYTLAARDLSWIYPGTWKQVFPGPGYLLLLGEDHMEQVSEEGKLLKSWDYASCGLTDYMPKLIDADFFDSIQGHVLGDLLGLEAVDWSDFEAGFYLFDLDSGELVTMTWSELNERFRGGSEPEDTEWVVEETEEGCRLTRGEDTLELPVPALAYKAQLWGDLVIFQSKARIFFRDGRELLPHGEGERNWDLNALPYGIGIYPLMEWDILLRTSIQDNLRVTRFVRPDGSVLGLTLEKPVDREDLGFPSADGGILGIVERDKASYYRIDTGECIFRIPLYYEGD